MTEQLVTEINEKGIVLGDGSIISWSDVRTVGKKDLVSVNIFTTGYPWQVYGHFGVQYYVKDTKGQIHLFSNFKQVKMLTTPGDTEAYQDEFFLWVVKLLKTALEHDSILFERTLSDGLTEPLDAQKELKKASFLLTPKGKAAFLARKTKGENKKIIIGVLMFLGIALWGWFIYRFCNPSSYPPAIFYGK